ncbi:MAG TPA: hypothetical protein VK090_04230 [Paracoccaceae bacterium]|nr:hypothetical protein [Paracoccaceae bacterium]
MFRLSSLALLGAFLSLSACGGSAPAPDGDWVESGGSTNSPIAGQTLRCASDYPDSRLVFDRDGSLSGRFGGSPVSGQWHTPATDEVEAVIRAGGISIRDRFRRTASGWQGESTNCG